MVETSKHLPCRAVTLNPCQIYNELIVLFVFCSCSFCLLLSPFSLSLVHFLSFIFSREFTRIYLATIVSCRCLFFGLFFFSGLFIFALFSFCGRLFCFMFYSQFDSSLFPIWQSVHLSVYAVHWENVIRSGIDFCSLPPTSYTWRITIGKLAEFFARNKILR